MSKINWGSSSTHEFENGVDHGVLYPIGDSGIPWSGLISVNEKESGASEIIKFYDGEQYRSQITLGSYSAVIECFTYPDVLDRYVDLNNGLLVDARKGNTYFNFSYRTITDKGYKIHLVYNAIAIPSNRSYSTLDSASEDAMTFSWNIFTVPVKVFGASPSSHFFIDSTLVHPWTLERVEKLLYGDDTHDPSIPSVETLISIFEEESIMQVIDHGDGTWTAQGPDDMIKILSDGVFEIDSPSAVYKDSVSYTVSSY